MRVRIRRKAALAASALFLGCCFVIYLIIETTMLPHHNDPTSPQSEQMVSIKKPLFLELNVLEAGKQKLPIYCVFV